MANTASRALRRARALAASAAKGHQDEAVEVAERAASGYADALAAASAKQERVAPEYGAVAEGLAESELDSSGYAAFLTEQGRQAYKADVAAAAAAYEAELDRSDAMLRESALDRILQNRAVRFNEAYGIAEEFGLHGEAAASVARTGAALAAKKRGASQSTLSNILKRLITERLTGPDALQYVLACGLSQAEAEMLAAAAETVIRNQESARDDYLGQLEDLFQK